MNNTKFLFAAFALVAAVFLIHNWLMSSRQKRIEKKLEELKDQLGQRK